MPTLARRISIAAFVLLGLAALGLLAANMYLQNQAVQQKIADEVSRVVHMPVRLGTTSVTPWHGLRISAVVVPQTSPGTDATSSFLKADVVEGQFRWLPLLRRRLVFDRITISRPHVVWYQNTAGKWRVPETPALAADVPAPPPQTAAEPTPAAPRKPARRPQKSVPPVQVDIRFVGMEGGSFEFLDNQGRLVAAFRGVSATAPSPTTAAVSGTATVARVSIRDRVFVTDVRTPFIWRDGVLEMESLIATLAGGHLTGTLRIEPARPSSPLTASTRFDAIDLDRLLTEAGGPAGLAAGKINGSLDLRGRAADADSLKGTATLSCVGGSVRNYEFFQSLARTFGIEELARLDFQHADARARIDDGKVLVDDLVLETPSLRLGCRGKIKFGGKLDLDARLTIGDRVASQLPQFVADAFAPTDDGRRAIDFDVTGTLERPRSNLLERLLGESLQNQALDLFRSILGPGHHAPGGASKP